MEQAEANNHEYFNLYYNLGNLLPNGREEREVFLLQYSPLVNI